jgi:hypothetical protein
LLRGETTEAVDFAIGLVGTPIAIFWGIAVHQMALRKHYRGFRLALIPYDPDHYKAQELQPTWQRAIRVWWLAFWRTYIVLIVLIAVPVITFGAVLAERATSTGASTGVRSMVAFGWIVLFFGWIVLFFFWLVWPIVVYRMALRKRYREFRIAVVPLDAPHSRSDEADLHMNHL